MRISRINSSQQASSINNKKNTQVQFSGWQQLKSKCLGVFDLDNSLMHGTNEEIKRIIETVSQRNGIKVYATGNTLEQVLSKQKKLASEGIDLPTPDYLISNNGQYIYENIEGFLVKDVQYESMLKSKTNFESKKVFELMKTLANAPKYSFNNQEYNKLTLLGNFESIKASDPDFYKSKITHYLWSPSNFMSEYIIAPGVKIKGFQRAIKKELENIGIKTKFIENLYPAKIVDKCPESIKLQSHSLRCNKDGGITAMFLCPADKADGVEYLKRKLNVAYKEILMAGDDDNDISMAKLAKKGAHFVAVNNSSNRLQIACLNVKTKLGTIFISQYEGAKGIIEGMTKAINN